MALSRRHPGAAPPSYPDPASSQVPTCPFPSAPGRVPALPARGTLGARRRQRRPQPQGGRCSPRQPSALPEGALTEVPAPLRRGLVGRAGAGEGPVRPRPALARMTEPRTGSPGASTRSCPPPSSAPAHRKTGAKGAAARLEMRATWAGKRLRLGRGPAPRPPPRLPPRRPTPPAAFLPASFYNGPLSARPRWAGDLAQPTPSRGDKPSLPQELQCPHTTHVRRPALELDF
nr:translation initiation factor IF-2-like [Manis javanica]